MYLNVVSHMTTTPLLRCEAGSFEFYMSCRMAKSKTAKSEL